MPVRLRRHLAGGQNLLLPRKSAFIQKRALLPGGFAPKHIIAMGKTPELADDIGVLLRPYAGLRAKAVMQLQRQLLVGSVFGVLERQITERAQRRFDLLVQAGVARVVIALGDPDPRTDGAGIARLRGAGITVETGIQADAARASMAGFLTRRASGRPHVTLKLATSLDGCIALASGESRWITGPEARAHTHLERARHEAILVGRGTYDLDAPSLDVRLPGLAERVAVLAPGGVDAALHSAPSDSLPDLLDIFGDTSQVVTVIDHDGAARLGVKSVSARNDSPLLRYAAALGQDGLYTPRVDHEFSVSDIAKAHSVAESGSGKVVVTLL